MPPTTPYASRTFAIAVMTIALSTCLAQSSPASTPTSGSDRTSCYGDLDDNGLVDLDDFASLLNCVAAGQPLPSACTQADTDSDGDVDLLDFARLQTAFTGCRSCGACRDSVSVTPGATELDYWRIVTPNAVARGAVCNDGCPYVYYVRPGRNGNENKWVFFLKGGGGCASRESCAVRWRAQSHWMRPRTQNWRPPTEGILNPDTTRNPEWGDWTLVYLHYCSSDLFTGDRPASCETDGWHFRGHRIIQAVLEDLHSPPNGLPNLGAATEAMFTGGSAGAYGVIHNLDWVAAQLAPTPVKGVADSATAATVVPELIEPMQLTSLTQSIFWNAQLDESCLASEADPLDCLDTQNVVPNHLSTPCYVYQDQFDANAFTMQQIHGLCLEEACSDTEPCAGDDECFQNICMGPTCDVDTPCPVGYCNEAGLCFGRECVEDGQCASESVCDQGFCADPLPLCESDVDCLSDEFCLNSVCARSVDCLTDGGCRQSETCIADMAVCVRRPGCDTSAACDTGEFCLNQMFTPYGQAFAADVRAFMQSLPHGYCTRWGSHVLLPKPRFFDGHVQGINYANLLANWYFERPGRTHVIDLP